MGKEAALLNQTYYGLSGCGSRGGVESIGRVYELQRIERLEVDGFPLSFLSCDKGSLEAKRERKAEAFSSLRGYVRAIKQKGLQTELQPFVFAGAI